jgi:hypothetical protein
VLFSRASHIQAAGGFSASMIDARASPKRNKSMEKRSTLRLIEKTQVALNIYFDRLWEMINLRFMTI